MSGAEASIAEGIPLERHGDKAAGGKLFLQTEAIAGALKGNQLTKVAVLNDYWFDWHTYHPKTLVYELGDR